MARPHWIALALYATVFCFLLTHAIFILGPNGAAALPTGHQQTVVSFYAAHGGIPGHSAPSVHDPSEPDATSRAQLVAASNADPSIDSGLLPAGRSPLSSVLNQQAPSVAVLSPAPSLDLQAMLSVYRC